MMVIPANPTCMNITARYGFDLLNTSPSFLASILDLRVLTIKTVNGLSDVLVWNVHRERQRSTLYIDTHGNMHSPTLGLRWDKSPISTRYVLNCSLGTPQTKPFPPAVSLSTLSNLPLFFFLIWKKNLKN